MEISALQKARYEYAPKLPGMLRHGIADICSHCRRITESCPADLYSERLVGYTTGWDLHPTLKNFTFINVLSI